MLPNFFYYSIANSQPNNLVDLFGRGVFGEKPTQGSGWMMRDEGLAGGGAIEGRPDCWKILQNFL